METRFRKGERKSKNHKAIVGACQGPDISIRGDLQPATTSYKHWIQDTSGAVCGLSFQQCQQKKKEKKNQKKEKEKLLPPRPQTVNFF